MSQSTPTATPLKEINELLIPYMAALVQSSKKSYRLPVTVWFCGLLSEKDSPVAKVLQYRVLPTLILFLTEENVPELQVEAAKAIKYIASGTSESARVTTDQAHDALWHLLHSKDEVLRHACCSLAVVSGCENLKIRQLVHECGLYNRLLELIRHPTLVVPALRTLGNMVEGNDYLIDCVIRDKVLVYLRSCLDHDHVDVRKEACWIISYITARNGRWIQDVFDADLLEPLVSLVNIDMFGVMEAAIRAISNATSGATPEQIRFMISRGCMEPLCYLFCCKKEKIFDICLGGIENILEAGELEKRNNTTGINPYVERINTIGGWEVLLGSAGDYENELSDKSFDLLRRHGILTQSCNAMQKRLRNRTSCRC